MTNEPVSMSSKVLYESIMLSVYAAIDSQVGKKRKYKDETDSHIEDIHYALLDALNLPEDYHL